MLRDLPRMGYPLSRDDLVLMTGASGTHEEHDETAQQSSIDPLDDVFGSAPSSPSILPADESRRGAYSNAEHSDVPRLRSIHVTNGYREGIAASKEKYIQAGFDEGYSLGGELGMKAGRCLGVLEGLCKAVNKKNTSNERAGLVARLQTLHEEAKRGLTMENLLSPEYFGQDGTWSYDVPGQDVSDEELQVTFKDVASAHPMLEKWSTTVGDLAEQLGIHVAM